MFCGDSVPANLSSENKTRKFSIKQSRKPARTIAIFYIASLLEIAAVELLYFSEDENKYTAFFFYVISRAIRIDCGVKENKATTKKSTYGTADEYAHRFVRNLRG